MAKKRDDGEQPEAMSTEMTETKVPVNVGMDTDALAVAETQNRQVGVDDSKEIRETLHEAAEGMSKTVDVPVQHADGQPLPEAAKAAIAAKDRPAPSGNTFAGVNATPDPNLSDEAVREVTLNGHTYTWRKGHEGDVPAEAVEVWERMKEANTP